MTMSQTESPAPNAGRSIRQVRVSVVDDHESVRLGLKAACDEAGFDFILAAASVDEFVANLDGRENDVVVLDLSLGDGSTVTENVKRVQATGSAVLVHSIADRVALVREAGGWCCRGDPEVVGDADRDACGRVGGARRRAEQPGVGHRDRRGP